MWVYLQITWVYTATLYENVSQVFETALTACVYTVTFFHKKKNVSKYRMVCRTLPKRVTNCRTVCLTEDGSYTHTLTHTNAHTHTHTHTHKHKHTHK